MKKRKMGQAVRPRIARNALMQLVIAAGLLLLVGLLQREFLSEVYVRNQLTTVSWTINGGIVILFLAAIIRLVQSFLRYDAEEQALNHFLDQVSEKGEIVQGIAGDTIIADRYRALRDLNQKRTRIDHSALAATLIAKESSRASFPRFAHNVMILTGVFGTIVSLSIALLGASEMIVGNTQISSLGLVVHGMSTALSTTMTAILAYFFLGYFYLRLADAQTQIIGRVEHATTTLLLPRFQVKEETLIEDFSDIIRAAGALVKRLDASQGQYAETANQLNEVLAAYRDEMRQHSKGLSEITELLRDGFRLRDIDR
ncbi:MAG: hypothetical protein CL402_10115 [Acidiferrobacteraceae bacterium]|nr:hypothetical protein [Acidiferrobacteraceae bacterium]